MSAILFASLTAFDFAFLGFLSIDDLIQFRHVACQFSLVASRPALAIQ
jgi:hypothetical protein